MSDLRQIKTWRDGRWLSHTSWRWDVWWDDGDNTGHGIGGWSRTHIGAAIAARWTAWKEAPN